MPEVPKRVDLKKIQKKLVKPALVETKGARTTVVSPPEPVHDPEQVARTVEAQTDALSRSDAFSGMGKDARKAVIGAVGANISRLMTPEIESPQVAPDVSPDGNVDVPLDIPLPDVLEPEGEPQGDGVVDFENLPPDMQRKLIEEAGLLPKPDELVEDLLADPYVTQVIREAQAEANRRAAEDYVNQLTALAEQLAASGVLFPDVPERGVVVDQPEPIPPVLPPGLEEVSDRIVAVAPPSMSPPIDARVSVEPVIGRVTAEPVIGRAPAEPVIERAPAEPVIGRAPAETVIDRAAAEPIRRAPAQPVIDRAPAKPRIEELADDDVLFTGSEPASGITYGPTRTLPDPDAMRRELMYHYTDLDTLSDEAVTKLWRKKHEEEDISIEDRTREAFGER